MAEAIDEGRHRPGPGRQWEESYSFDFASADGSLGGYVRLAVRPADDLAWYWVAFVSGRTGPHPSLVLVRDHDVPLPRGRSLEVRTSGLWADHTCETPLDHWTVGVEAFGVSLDDPREAFGGERGDLCPLGLDLEWEAGEWDTGPRDGGYEQPCSVHGEVLVGSERIQLDGFGWRSHAWGDRDWWSGAEGARPAWAGGHLEDGTPFGTHHVDVVTDDGLVVSASLADHGLTATPLAHAPFAVPGPGGRTSRLDRALCRFEASDGRRGTGWVETLTPPPPV